MTHAAEPAQPRPAAAPAAVPSASYRLQLQPGFTLHDATAAVPYLAALGVSHLHLSPLLAAAPGSTHGYDTVDHGGYPSSSAARRPCGRWPPRRTGTTCG